MTWLARVCKKYYICKFYHDGDTYGFVWRWWNPLSWVMAPMYFVLSVLIQGIPETLEYKHELGFGLSPYFKERKDELQWM